MDHVMSRVEIINEVQKWPGLSNHLPILPSTKGDGFWRGDVRLQIGLPPELKQDASRVGWDLDPHTHFPQHSRPLVDGDLVAGLRESNSRG